MPIEHIELLAPIGGLRKNAGYQQKPPFFFESGINVRPFDVNEGRGRIGSRPGLLKSFQEQLGNDVDLVVNGDFSASTDWTLDTGWSIAGGKAVASTSGVTQIEQNVARFVVGATYEVTYTISNYVQGGIRTGFDDLSTSATRRTSDGTFVESLTVHKGDGGGEYAVLFFLTDSNFIGDIDDVSATLQSGAPIRLASVVRTFNDAGNASFLDLLDTSANWDAASWATATADFASAPGVAIGPATVDTEGNVLKTASVPSMSQDAPRTLYLDIPPEGTYSTNKTVFRLYGNMDDTTPVNTDSVSAELDFGTAGQWSLSIYTGTTLRTNVVAAGTLSGGTLSLLIESNKLTATWTPDSDIPLTVDYSTALTPAGNSIGFTMQRSQTGLAAPAVTAVRASYVSTSGGLPPEAAVFSANGALYRENTVGNLAEVTGSSVDLASDRTLYAASRLEKLYIADYEVRRERLIAHTNATIVQDGGLDKLLDSDVTDFTALGIDVSGDVLELLETSGGTPTPIGVYPITAVATDRVTFTADGTTTATSVAYRILRYPKVYDSANNALTRVSLGTVGTSQFPAGCRSLVLWADRLVACNDPNTPQGWWMSRAGYPGIWDYGDSGTVDEDGTTTGDLVLPGGIAAAVNGTQSEFAGLIGEPLVTTIPITDDLLVFACRTSFYILRGNPRLGGTLDNITREIGIVGIGAWCRTATGRLIVLTPDGLYEITPTQAIPLSRDVIPQELIGLTDDLYQVGMAYDVRRRGVLISAAGGTSIHYFYDERTGGFFPQSHSTDHEPTAVVSYQPGGIGISTVLWGSRDGYVRRFDDAAEDDDGTDWNSHVLYGPIRIGRGEWNEGILHDLVCSLDENSNDVTVSIQGGYNAQAASMAVARYSTTMSSGRNRTRSPRLRYGAVYVKVTGTAGGKWVVESMSLSREVKDRLVVY